MRLTLTNRYVRLARAAKPENFGKTIQAMPLRNDRTKSKTRTRRSRVDRIVRTLRRGHDQIGFIYSMRTEHGRQAQSSQGCKDGNYLPAEPLAVDACCQNRRTDGEDQAAGPDNVRNNWEGNHIRLPQF